MRQMALDDLSDLRLLGIDGVLQLVPLSKPTVYRGIKEGTFPRQRTYRGRAMWRETDIRAWIESNFPSEISRKRRNDDDLI